jgi:acetyl-CoA C-acetyltransferase
MPDAFLIDYIRTPIGRYGGALSQVRPDDLASQVIREVAERVGIAPDNYDDVYFGAANQAGEDNRNVARMASLLAGLPVTVPGATINRLCGSGMEAVGLAVRAIRSDEAELVIAGGVESMSRAPKVMSKATSAFDRSTTVHDTTIGWRFVNPRMAERFGVDEMPGTAENVAKEFSVSREDQDAFAYRSQARAERARVEGVFEEEISPVSIKQRKGDPVVVAVDEHPRADTSMEKLSMLGPIFEGGTVTAGNASGINDGASATVVASEAAVEKYNLTPMARIVGMSTAGVPPRIMGMGPVPATTKLLGRTGVDLSDITNIELNEAFAAQGLACMRELGLPDDAEHVNPNGGAIALGHPLGMTGNRLVGTAARELARRDGRYAVATMCIGVGQGIAMLLERS